MEALASGVHIIPIQHEDLAAFTSIPSVCHLERSEGTGILAPHQYFGLLWLRHGFLHYVQDDKTLGSLNRLSHGSFERTSISSTFLTPSYQLIQMNIF